jgi:single-strand DNA-binding protein
MNDTITLIGIAATDPRTVTTTAGLDIASFRLASTPRRYDRSKDEWVDGDTNWYTITAFRVLAANVAACVRKGDRVVVTGRLRVRSWESGDKSGTTVEVDADTVGHDLRWGRSTYLRTSTAVAAPSGGAAQPAGDASARQAPASPEAGPGWAAPLSPGEGPGPDEGDGSGVADPSEALADPHGAADGGAEGAGPTAAEPAPVGGPPF